MHTLSIAQNKKTLIRKADERFQLFKD